MINDNLEAFAAIEPGQALLTGIAETGKSVTFEYFSMPNGTCAPLDRDNNHYEIEETAEGTTYTPGDGSSSKVQINPAFIDMGAASAEYASAQFAEQNTMLVMAHELCHAYNNATGTIDDQYYNNYTGELGSAGDPNTVLGAELQAVGLFDDSVISANPYGMTENDYREYFHMNPRDSYLPPKE
ncbi:MAG: M91 family zinc metallopeptidase [bacterium]|nr:M91 family zinc metallopeptidase [bacterium]